MKVGDKVLAVPIGAEYVNGRWRPIHEMKEATVTDIKDWNAISVQFDDGGPHHVRYYWEEIEQ